MMIDFLQSLVDGVLVGTTYSLIGIGFTLIFGVMHKINLSYASASVGGAYCGLLLVGAAGGKSALLVFLMAAAAAGVIGYVVYLTCFRFIPASHPLGTLMSTVGMLLLIDEIVVHATFGVPVAYPPLYEGPSIELGELYIRPDYLMVFAVGIAAMTVLTLLLYRSRLGLATRAVSQQPVAAQLCGIALYRVNAATFVVTGVLGGIAGAMIGASVGMLSPLLVLPLTVKGLIVTVIGGLGSIPGAIVAGLMVGGFENVLQYYRGVTERDLYVMLLLFVFLVFRPGGLFAAKSERN
ncbi:MAG: branched-chain amino acid ABC transporter permease [Alphaproteobacteria bacterium]|nr:branched-chain amino acid ABC transporter permease [Alphaproteobacteria bacterium]